MYFHRQKVICNVTDRQELCSTTDRQGLCCATDIGHFSATDR